MRRRLRVPLWLRAVTALVCAGLGGAGMWWAWGRFTDLHGLWVSAGVALLLAALGYVTAHFIYTAGRRKLRSEVRRLLDILAGRRDEMRALDAVLSELAPGDEASLGALLERLKQRDEEAGALAQRESLLPPLEERKAAVEAFQQAIRDHETFIELTREFAERFEDVSSAYGRWKDACERQRSALERAHSYAQESFGCEPGAADGCDLGSGGLSQAWRQVALVVGVVAPEEEITAVGQLIEFLKGPDAASWWEGAELEATQHERLRRELDKLAAVTAERQRLLQDCEAKRADLEREYTSASAGLGAALEPAGGDPRRAKERWAEWRRARLDIEKTEAALAKILEDHQVASCDELFVKQTAAESDALGAQLRWQELIDKNPGLPERTVADDPERVAALSQALDGAVSGLALKLRELENAHDAARDELRRLESQAPINIAEAELRLADLERRRDDVDLLADALAKAHRELDEAVAEFHSSHRSRLEEVTTKYFRSITGIGGRAVLIDDEFTVNVEADGRPVDISQLSRGAQDQLYVAVRLACADLLAADVKLPFIFDDPFVTFDSNRLQNIASVVRKLGEERQVLVLSHSDALSSWGPRAKATFAGG